MDHLTVNNLIKESQHGFLPGKSCATNLVKFMDKVTKAVDEGKSVDIFYLDFAKAFDKVPRQRLMKKLRAKGLDEKAAVWIENWLTDRTQKVKIKGEMSTSCNVDSGVPQGTVLGPPLFTVYIDDLEDEVIERLLDVLVMKFADDTKGAKVIEGEEDRQKLQQALDCLCDWADRWGMAFNFEKCKIMHIGRHNPQFEYYMRGEKVSTTDEERDIGVAITKNLKPAAQCSKAAGRAMAVLHQIRRNFHYRDRYTFVRLYKQYVRPHLEFASQAWSPWLAGDREVLEKVQKKAVGMVSGLKGKSYEERCAELGLETMETRKIKQVMSLVHKLISNGGGEELFTTAGGHDGVRTRRAAAANGLSAPFARTDIRKYSFAVRTVEHWNSLPEGARTANSQQSFKELLKNIKM
jgi:hypothetical protein